MDHDAFWILLLRMAKQLNKVPSEELVNALQRCDAATRAEVGAALSQVVQALSYIEYSIDSSGNRRRK